MLRWMVGTNMLGCRAARGALLASLGLLAMTVAVPIASAQTNAPKAAKAPAAQSTAQAAPGATAAPAANGQQQQANWVKLCDKSPQTNNKQMCITTIEKINDTNGITEFAIAVQQIEGQDTQKLLVKLNEAALLSLRHGVQVRIDDGQPWALAYDVCYGLCQAALELTPDQLDSLRKGKQMVVTLVNMQGKELGVAVPMGGFDKAYQGSPLDFAKYMEGKKQLIDQIRKRQAELASKAQPKGQSPDGQAQVDPTQAVPSTGTVRPKGPANPDTGQ